MKKILFGFVFALCLVFGVSSNVNATEVDTPEYSADCFYSGQFNYEREYHLSSGDYLDKVNFQYSSDSPLYIIKYYDSDGNRQISYYVTCGELRLDNMNNIPYLSDDMFCLKTYSQYCDDVPRYENNSDTYNFSFLNTAPSPLTFWVDEINNNYESQYSYNYTLPVFDFNDENFEENVNKYLYDGDFSGALNEYEISQPDFAEDVELPRNLRTYGHFVDLKHFTLDGHKDVVTVRWDSPVDIEEYTYDVRARVYYQQGTDLRWTEFVDFVTDYPYDSGSTIDINTGQPVSIKGGSANDFSFTRYNVGKCIETTEGSKCWALSYYVHDIEVYVRNRKGNSCSNWVHVTIGGRGGSYAEVTDKDGNVIDDEYYNGQNVDNSDGSSWFDSDGVNASLPDVQNSVSSITSFIRGGFGLLGNNGILALMSNVFRYIPASVWDLIKMAISMSILIMVIALIKNLVFS